MRLNYFGYSVMDKSNNTHFIFDMRPIIKAFVELESPKFKNSFVHLDDNIYLLKSGENFYVYLVTKSNDVIKRVKKTNLSFSAIQDLLEEDENIGFASYIYMDDSYLGFASTLSAPRHASFSKYINEVFDKIGLKNYNLILHPLTREATFSDALSMYKLGRSTLQVTPDNGLFKDMRDFFGGSAEEFKNIDSIEITIKPRPQQDIKKAIAKVIKNRDEEGLKKFITRATEHVGDQALDLYLVGSGQLSDEIGKGNDFDINKSVLERLKSNQTLEAKVKEHQSHAAFKKQRPQDFDSFSSSDGWSSAVSNLPTPAGTQL